MSNGFKPITSQAELDAVIAERLKRERRKVALPAYRKLIEILADLYDVTKTLEKWSKD